jgi:hypothetical protein
VLYIEQVEADLLKRHSELFPGGLTATISTTFIWLGIFDNHCGPSKPKLFPIPHGSEFAGHFKPEQSEDTHHFDAAVGI